MTRMFACVNRRFTTIVKPTPVPPATLERGKGAGYGGHVPGIARQSSL